MHPSVRKQQYLLRSQHYILKESITDSSSDEEENGKANKRLCGRKESPERLDECTNNLCDEVDVGISLPDTRGEMEVIDITEDVSENEEDNSTHHITPPPPPSAVSATMSNTQRESMAPPVINMSDLVPLRRRATSDLGLGPGLAATSSTLSSNTEVGPTTSYRATNGIGAITSGASHSSEKEKVVAETPERWRNRLWPGKAIIAYCRIITRCKPPDVKVGERLSLSKDSIRAHWRANEMNKIGVFFDNVMMHSSAFFLLTVEESRAAVTNSDDAEQQLALAVDNELSSENNTGSNTNHDTPHNNNNTNTNTNNNTNINNSNTASTTTSNTTSSNSTKTTNNLFTPTIKPTTNNNNNTNNNNTNNTTNTNINTTNLPSSIGSTEAMGANGWLDCEIIGIVGTSELGALPQACDPRLGSVWIVSVAIKTPNIHVSSDPSATTSSARRGGAGSGRVASSSSSSSFLVKESSLSGGDLVVMRGSQWSHAMLGIVQPWDPDYDLKFGANFHAYTSSQHYTRLGDTFYNDNCTDLTTANILICVDSGESAPPPPTQASSGPTNNTGRGVTSSGLRSDEDIGGWAAQGAIHPGVTFSMAIVGNVLTYIRECQALMSLKLLNPALRDAVLKPYQPPLTPLEVRERSGSISGVVVGGMTCPRNLPHKLWAKLADDFNESQLSAIHEVCKREAATSASASVCLLQGPPGSGKTKTILGILSALLAGALRPPQRTVKVIAGSSFRNDSKTLTQQSEILGKRPRSDSVSSDFNFNSSSNASSNHTAANTSSSSHNVVGSSDRPRVLVCAPSNTAVDELVFRILTQGLYDADGYRAEDLNVVRIGTSSFLRAGSTSANASSSLSSSPDVYAAPLTEEDANVMRVVERVSLENIVEDRRKALLASDAKKQLGVSFKYSDIRKQILEKADVVCCTLSGAGSQPILEVILRITGYRFDAVVIDEAAQAVEPSSLIPFKYNPQLVVLVGDPCQLPATVFSRTAKDANYAQSLFLRLQKSGHPVTMLCRQYRMHPLIAQYPSIRFYHGRLVTDPTVNALTTHYKPYHEDASGRFRPFLFHDLLYSREESDNTSSIRNRDEARYILSLYDALTRRYPNHRKNIGIIAPYRAQRRLLMQLFQQRYGLTSLDTEIATVDGFQGREKDVIIFSCTRASQSWNSSNAEAIGFLREWQRLNVAITRAKYALWIVGNSRTLQRDGEWSELISYARRQHCLLPFPSEKSTRFPDHMNNNNNNNNRHHQNNNNNNSSYSSGNNNSNNNSNSNSGGNGNKNKNWKKNKDKHKHNHKTSNKKD